MKHVAKESLSRSTATATAATAAMSPLRDLVLLRLRTTSLSRSGIRADGSTYELLAPVSAIREEPMGYVEAAGPDCSLVSPGQLVMFNENMAIRTDPNNILQIGHAAHGNQVALSGPGSVLIRECDILAVLEAE